MLQKITEKELRIQEALGSLPEEYRNALCRHRTPEVSKGKRTCHFCNLKCINKGDEFYLIETETGGGGGHWVKAFNICKTCSWLTIQTINRIINEHNTDQPK